MTHTAVTIACHQHRLAAVKAAGTHRAQQRCEAGCKGLRFRLMVLAWHPLGEFHSPPPAGVTQEFQRWAHARVASEQPKRFLLPLLSPTSPLAIFIQQLCCPFCTSSMLRACTRKHASCCARVAHFTIHHLVANAPVPLRLKVVAHTLQQQPHKLACEPAAQRSQPHLMRQRHVAHLGAGEGAGRRKADKRQQGNALRVAELQQNTRVPNHSTAHACASGVGSGEYMHGKRSGGAVAVYVHLLLLCKEKSRGRSSGGNLPIR